MTKKSKAKQSRGSLSVENPPVDVNGQSSFSSASQSNGGSSYEISSNSNSNSYSTTEIKATKLTENPKSSESSPSKGVVSVSDKIEFGLLGKPPTPNGINKQPVSKNNQSDSPNQSPTHPLKSILSKRNRSTLVNQTSNEGDDNLITEEFIVPQIIKVVSLAECTQTAVQLQKCNTNGSTTNVIVNTIKDGSSTTNSDPTTTSTTTKPKRRRRRNKNTSNSINITPIDEDNDNPEKDDSHMDTDNWSVSATENGKGEVFQIAKVHTNASQIANIRKNGNVNYSEFDLDYDPNASKSRGVNHSNNIVLVSADTTEDNDSFSNTVNLVRTKLKEVCLGDGESSNSSSILHNSSSSINKSNIGGEASTEPETILGLDLEEDFCDEEDEGASGGSWYLSPTANLNKHESLIPGESLNSSESGSIAGSSSTTGAPHPTLSSCNTVFDGILNLCEVDSCSKPAVKKCSSCKQAFYCGEEHQRSDWKRHKFKCSPFKFEYIVEGADGEPVMAHVAARNIHAGQIIFVEKPFLVFPLAAPDDDFSHVMDYPCIRSFVDDPPDCLGRTSSSTRGLSPVIPPGFYCEARKPACFGCMKVVEFIGPARHQCTRCGLPLCSEHCEFEISHQLGECHAILASGGLGDDEITKSCYHSLYMDVEILRALQLENYDHSLWEKFIELRYNVRVLTYKKSLRFKIFTQKVKTLVPYSAKISGYNYDLIMDAHSIITALSFRPCLKSSYKMLFSQANEFAHECVPNTLQFVEDEKTGDPHKMKLITKASLPILKGELITVDFAPNPYLPYPFRRKILENLSIHNCTCRRCTGPSKFGDTTADILCPFCKKGLVSTENPQLWENSVWSCAVCQEETPYAKIQDIEKKCKRELSTIIRMGKIGLPRFLNFVEKRAACDLNPGHGLILMAWAFIETHLRPSLEAVRSPDPHIVHTDETIESFKIMEKYCDAAEKHLNCIRPGIWIDKGITLIHKFFANFTLTCRNFQQKEIVRKEFIQQLLACLKTLKEALQIMTVYDGFNSSKEVMLLTQEGTGALSQLKQYVEKLMIQDQEETCAASMPRLPI